MKEGRYQIEELPQYNMNYFRESYASSKQIDKESNLPTMRLKEDLTKAKPRLLTGRLPDAFKVKEQLRDKKEPRLSHKLVMNNFNQRNSIKYCVQDSTSSYKSESINKKQDSSDPLSSDNSDSDKAKIANEKLKDKEGTFSTRTRTESDETDNERNIFRKPISIKGTSPFSSCKAKTIDKSRTMQQEQQKEGEFNKENVNGFFKQQRTTNTIVNSNAKTHSLFPKISIDNLSPFRTSQNKGISLSNRKFALEEGYSYFINNSNYKYYFYVPTIDLYFLKEIEYTPMIIEDIKSWKMKNDDNDSFLHIHQYVVNNPEGCISIIIDHPFGFSLLDIINSTGVADNYLLNKIAKNCLLFLSEYNKANQYRDYGSFCLCDLFFDVNSNMKVIPNILQYNSQCECKSFLNQISKRLKMPLISQYFSLGVILLKCAIGNIPLRSIDLLLTMPHKQIPIKCCLLHTILSIENSMIRNDNSTLLLSNFLRQLPEKFTQLLCELLSFDTERQSSALSNTWLSQMAIRPNVCLHMKELLKMVIPTPSALSEPNLITFCTNFDIVLSHLKDVKDRKLFLSNLRNKINVLDFICHIFDIEPNDLFSKLQCK